MHKGIEATMLQWYELASGTQTDSDWALIQETYILHDVAVNVWQNTYLVKCSSSSACWWVPQLCWKPSEKRMRKVHEGSGVLVLDGQTFPKICPKQDPSPIGSNWFESQNPFLYRGTCFNTSWPIALANFPPILQLEANGWHSHRVTLQKTATVATRFPAGLVGVQCIEVLQCILASFPFQKPGPWWYKYLRYYYIIHHGHKCLRNLKARWWGNMKLAPARTLIRWTFWNHSS